MLYYARGAPDLFLDSEDLQKGLQEAYSKLGERKNVLAIPPDFTRFHSRAGEVTVLTRDYYGEALKGILPALGTHFPMTPKEIEKMFPSVAADLFIEHNWRSDVVPLGEVPASYIEEISEGKLSFTWPAQVNRLLVEGGYDLILSIGQVVPHEVIGMANHNKNIFIGTGGADGIGKSHYLGAVYGMERIMGRAITPVRQVLNYASKHFAQNMPIVYVLTVLGPDEKGKLCLRGLFIGDDEECFILASELSLKVNFTLVEKPLKKVVVYLDPEEYKSTWLGNKSIYRTRMALADDGELIVLAPGVRSFGEDPEIDRLIRKYGYCGTEKVLQTVQDNPDLAGNLGAAAHLIHGSSEGRFKITYCTEHLSQQEVEGAGFSWMPYEKAITLYNKQELKDGVNDHPYGELFYISNPALGLWSYRGNFHN